MMGDSFSVYSFVQFLIYFMLFPMHLFRIIPHLTSVTFIIKFKTFLLLTVLISIAQRRIAQIKLLLLHFQLSTIKPLTITNHRPVVCGNVNLVLINWMHQSLFLMLTSHSAQPIIHPFRFLNIFRTALFLYRCKIMAAFKFCVNSSSQIMRLVNLILMKSFILNWWPWSLFMWWSPKKF